MPNPYLEWTDSVGLARLTCLVPVLQGWTPDVDPIGPAEEALGTGTTFLFTFRTDRCVSFTFPNISPLQMTEALRLKEWLLTGGSITLFTGDLAARSYVAKLRPKTVPRFSQDPESLEFALALELINTVPGVPFVASWVGAGLLMTPETDYTALGGTFSRSATARYLAGPTPLLAEEPSNVLRRRHYVGARRTYLMGAADNNHCPKSEDLSGWTPGAGTGSATGGKADPEGGTTAYELNDTDGAVAKYWESPSFGAYIGAHTSRGFSWYVKAVTGTIPDVEIIDVSAGNVVRARFLHTITAGVPVVTQTVGTGAVISVVPSTTVPGHYRVLVYVNGLTVANTHRFRAYPASAVSAAAIGATIFWGFQAHNRAAAVSEYLPNAGASGSVSIVGDTLNLPWTVAPGPMTWYLRYIEIGGALIGSVEGSVHIMARIGGSSAGRLDFLCMSGTGYPRASHENANGAVTSSLASIPAYGDRVELLGVLYPDGSVQLFRSINGAVLEVATRSGPLAFVPEWIGTKVFQLGSSNSSYPHERFGVFPGVYTMDEVRSLAQ